MIKPDQFLPHARPMLMIDEVTSIDDSSIQAKSKIKADCPFLVNGQFPAFYCTEIVAQASGILFGIKIRECEKGRAGAIIQIRHFQSQADSVHLHDHLSVHSTLLGGNESVALFEGHVYRDNTPIFTSNISITLLTEHA